MARTKRKRFEEVKSLSNITELTYDDASSWWRKFSKKPESILLEVGCGKGEYTIALAQKYPNALCIGIDVKGERLWRGAQNAIKQSLTNVHFLRAEVNWLTDILPPHSVQEIWITFPTPFSSKRRWSRELISPKFIDLYKSVLKKNGKVILKTDNAELFNRAHENFKEDWKSLQPNPITNDAQSTFEKKYKEEGKKILMFGWQRK